MQPAITKLSWTDIERLSNELAAKVTTSGYAPDVLIGVAMGGLVPLYFLGKLLKVPEVFTIAARSYDKDAQKEITISNLPSANLAGKKVLLVDEIVDTGNTFKKISELIRTEYEVGELRTATLAVNTTNCRVLPDYHVLDSADWVVFPWEKIEFPEHFA